MILFRTHKFPDRSAFLAAVASAGEDISDSALPVTAIGGSDLLDIGTVVVPGPFDEATGEWAPGVPMIGYWVVGAWRDAVPGSFAPSIVERPSGCPCFAGQPAAEAAEAEAPPPPPPVEDPVPSEIDNVQARIMLMQMPSISDKANLFEDVNAALQAESGAAWQFWEYSNKIYRYGSPLVEALAVVIGLTTEAAKDQFFRTASKISG